MKNSPNLYFNLFLICFSLNPVTESNDIAFYIISGISLVFFILGVISVIKRFKATKTFDFGSEDLNLRIDSALCTLIIIGYGIVLCHACGVPKSANFWYFLLALEAINILLYKFLPNKYNKE